MSIIKNFTSATKAPSDLEKEVQLLTEELKHYKAIKDMIKMKKDLEAENDRLLISVKESRADYKGRQEDLAVVTKELDLKNRELKNATSDIEEVQKKSNTLTSSNSFKESEVTQKLVALQSRVEDLNKFVTQREKELSDLEAKIKRQQENEFHTIQEIASLQAQKSALNADLATFASDRKQVEENNKLALVGLEEDKKSLQNDIFKLRAEVNHLEELKKEKQSEYTNIDKNISDLLGMESDLQKNVDELNSKINILSIELTEMRQKEEAKISVMNRILDTKKQHLVDVKLALENKHGSPINIDI
jgi:chromosome segregation ATPase